MERRIERYVRHQLRHLSKEERKGHFETISTELIDRYHQAKSEGKSEREAYLEAISAIETVAGIPLPDARFSVPPRAEDAALFVGAALAGGALLVALFNVLAGTILLVASIATFGTGAFFTFSAAEYLKRQGKDKEQYPLKLRKLFSYMRSCFGFYTVTLAFLTAYLIGRTYLIGRLGALGLDPVHLRQADFLYVVGLSVIVFIAALAVFGFLFAFLYRKLGEHYELLTGEDFSHHRFSSSGYCLKSGLRPARVLDEWMGPRFFGTVSLLYLLGYGALQLFIISGIVRPPAGGAWALALAAGIYLLGVLLLIPIVAGRWETIEISFLVVTAFLASVLLAAGPLSGGELREVLFAPDDAVLLYLVGGAVVFFVMLLIKAFIRDKGGRAAE